MTTTTSACPSAPPASDTTAPTKPGTVTVANSTTTSVSIAWGASTDNVGVKEYGLYRDTTSAGATTALNSTFSGLSCGTSYSLSVDAVDAAELLGQVCGERVDSSLPAPAEPHVRDAWFGECVGGYVGW